MSNVEPSKYRKLSPTPDQYRRERNPYDQVGNIIFGPMEFKLGQEDGYITTDSFTHGEQETIQGRAYFPAKTLDIVRKISESAGFSNYQLEVIVYNSEGKEITTKYLEQVRLPKDENDWQNWDQVRVYITPNKQLKSGDKDLLQFLESLSAGTYKINVTYWLVASPYKTQREEFDPDAQRWVKNYYWADPKWYILSIGSFDFVLPEGWKPKAPPMGPIKTPEDLVKAGISKLGQSLKGKFKFGKKK